MIKTSPLFTIYLHKVNVPEWPSVKEEIMSLVPFDNKEFIEDTDDGTITYTDYRRENLELPYVTPLTNLFQPHLEEFLQQSEYKFREISWVWCQKYTKGEFHMPHNHGPLGYSCVFYANLTEDQKSTVFVSPFMNTLGNYDIRLTEVTEGDLIIFPSNLLHFASTNKTVTERIIFSMNLK